MEMPSEGEFVELTFEGEFGNQSPIKGEVLECSEETEDIPETDMLFIVRDSAGGRNVIYSEGNSEAIVTVRNRNQRLGKNADWRLLE